LALARNPLSEEGGVEGEIIENSGEFEYKKMDGISRRKIDE
jgi:hypothetical protein